MYGYRSLAFAGLILIFFSACQADSQPSDDNAEATGDIAGSTSDDVSPTNGIVDLTVDLAPPESGYQLVTEPSIVPAGSEVEICSVIRVEAKGDEKLFWVHELESLISEGSHHMNVLLGQFSFYDAFLVWCMDRNAVANAPP